MTIHKLACGNERIRTAACSSCSRTQRMASFEERNAPRLTPPIKQDCPVFESELENTCARQDPNGWPDPAFTRESDEGLCTVTDHSQTCGIDEEREATLFRRRNQGTRTKDDGRPPPPGRRIWPRLPTAARCPALRRMCVCMNGRARDHHLL